MAAGPGEDAGERSLSVVIAHDFAEAFGGAERVLAAMAETFPQAPVWAILGRQEVAARIGIADRFATLLPQNGRLLKHYRALTPLYPSLVRASRLPEADVLLTSSYAFAHGFATRNGAPQVCFCHSPLRFAWSMTDAYGRRVARGPLSKRAFSGLAAAMRALDKRASRAVTRYLVGSEFVAGQIKEFYGREAELVRPPIDCETFRPASEGHEGYFLFCGRLVEPYKRPSLVVDAFASLPHELRIAGDGPALADLRRRAGRNVTFLGHLDDRDLVPLMQRCAAAIFPSRDDFGLLPLEVMACGRPVLAYAAGGALETVVPGRTGELFADKRVDTLTNAIRGFDPDAYDPGIVRAHAEGWHADRFRAQIRSFVLDMAS